MITYIALGSNLGDRSENLTHALELLAVQVRIVKSSSIYETEPWGVTEQPLFLNQVIEGETEVNALELLRFLKQIEQEMGRTETIRFGPRVIDLDVLLYEDLQMDTPELTIPHPRMTQRAFVLVPLAEIAPLVMIPGTGMTVKEALAGMELTSVRKLEGNS